MQLERSTAVLRPRGAWEAMDLGFLLAQRHFVTLWLLWCATAVPVFILAHILFGVDNLLAAITLFWWLKPLYEPLASEWLGHALFDEQSTPKTQLKKTRAIIPRGLIGNLTWRRLSPSRSFNMPVHQLERLKGERYGKRLQTLHTTNPHSGWLTILCVHLEMALQLSIPMLILMLIPAEIDFGFEDVFFGDSELFAGLLNNFIYFIVASVIAPFYVAAGFALYINARTRLEAWDIEIAFRRMASSLRKETATRKSMNIAAGFVIALITASFTFPENVYAIERATAKETITEILEDEAFGKEETVTYWKPKNELETDSVDFNIGDSYTMIADGIRILAWVAMGVFLVWLLTRIAANIDFLRSAPAKRRSRARTPLRLLETEDQEEPIPENPVDVVLELCRQKRYRDAMSLLYRSALMNYVLYHDMEIPYSATERECVQIVAGVRPEPEIRYFSNLTRYWQWLAWGDMTPSEAKIRELCDQWHDHFPAHAVEVADET